MNIHVLLPLILMQHGLLIGLTVCMLAVIASDVAFYIIPNSLNLVILLLYLVAIFFLPVHPLGALSAAAVVLLVGLGLFALGVMGGGDIKLLVVLALWTGWGMTLLQFLFMTALFGAVLVIVVLLLRMLLPPLLFQLKPTLKIPQILARKQPVPYGLAIAVSFMVMLWMGMIPGLPALKLM